MKPPVKVRRLASDSWNVEAFAPDPVPARALSVRQPYAEMILRGVKTIEYRSKPTRLVGERFYLYASKGKTRGLDAQSPHDKIWSLDLAVPHGAERPAWMDELMEQFILNQLPTGVIVGTAVISKVTRGDDYYHWHLTQVERALEYRKPTRQPQPVWFKPY